MVDHELPADAHDQQLRSNQTHATPAEPGQAPRQQRQPGTTRTTHDYQDRPIISERAADRSAEATTANADVGAGDGDSWKSSEESRTLDGVRGEDRAVNVERRRICTSAGKLAHAATLPLKLRGGRVVLLAANVPRALTSATLLSTPIRDAKQR